MLKGKYVLLSVAATLVCWQVAGINAVNSGIVDPCKSTATLATPGGGVVLVCPQGDGDMLSATASGNNCTITLTVKDNTNTGIAGIPVTDMWLVACGNSMAGGIVGGTYPAYTLGPETGMLNLCGGSQGSAPDAATNGSGVTTFTNEPVAGGCDTGLYVVVQGVVIQNVNCLPLCLPIAARSPDYKGGAACTVPANIDFICPDGQVKLGDYSWFTNHYPTAAKPLQPYWQCADYASPFGGSIALGDFSKFSVHYAGSGHKCPQ